MGLLMEALQGERGWDLLHVNSLGSSSACALLAHTSGSEQARVDRAEWPCTLLIRAHRHPKTPAMGAGLTSTDTPVTGTHRANTPAQHGYRPLKASEIQNTCPHLKGNSSSLKASAAGHTDTPDGSYAYPQHLGP